MDVEARTPTGAGPVSPLSAPLPSSVSFPPLSPNSHRLPSADAHHLCFARHTHLTMTCLSPCANFATDGMVNSGRGAHWSPPTSIPSLHDPT